MGPGRDQPRGPWICSQTRIVVYFVFQNRQYVRSTIQRLYGIVSDYM